MLVKGIVEQIVGSQVKVRVPIFNRARNATGATPTKELSNAPICTITHFDPQLTVGDIVFVDYENNDTDLPVVIGVLYKTGLSNSKGNLALHSLSVEVDTTLSEETTIGSVLPKEIKCLQGTRENIQAQIDDIIPNSTHKKAQLMWGDKLAYSTFSGKANEQWTVGITAYTGISCFIITVANAGFAHWSENCLDCVLCEEFPSMTFPQAEAGTRKFGLVLHSDGSLCFFTSSSVFPDLTAWKSYLTQNPITVYYEGK